MFGGKKQQFHIQLAGDGQIFKCELGQRALKKPLKDALILPFLQAGKGGVPTGEQRDIRRVDVSSSDADLQRLSLIYNASTPAKDFVDLADNPSVIKVVVHVPDAYTSNYPTAESTPVDADDQRRPLRPSQAEQQRLDALLATLDVGS